MTPVSLLEKSAKVLSFEEQFLQELIEQFHCQDRTKVYQSWSDLLILEFFMSGDKSLKNFNVDRLNQLAISAYYHAIARFVERETGHKTQTFVHVKNKEFSSAVVFCGGVLVVYALIRGNKKYGFDSSERLLQEAKTTLQNAIAKASLYLDFAA